MKMKIYLYNKEKKSYPISLKVVQIFISTFYSSYESKNNMTFIIGSMSTKMC